MSASLVGSEMCIRDSSSVPPAFGGDRSAGGATLGSTRVGTRLSRDPCAVSYTHLTLPTICSV
eukprot:2882546-Alexandrium_andersonii.AAC.1